MKKLVLSVALMALGGAAGAQSLGGVWKTQPNDDGNFAHVEFAPCGATLCGKMIASFDPAGKPITSPNNGKNIVWDMEDAGNGAFQNGKIWDPGKDKTYRSKMQMNGNSMKVSGCVGPICKAQTWTKVR